jgi:quinoprotein glucose dehydrogenase
MKLSSLSTRLNRTRHLLWIGLGTFSVACAAHRLDTTRLRSTVEWTAYAHDSAGTKYSSAAQITRENVHNLQPAWTYRTGDFVIGDAMARDETTPLFVDNVLYASTPFGGVRAIDGDTGTEHWSFDSQLDLSSGYGDFTNRGVSTWLDPSSAVAAACHRRIFVATVDARLIALDAGTGVPCNDFGSRGVVVLNRDVVNAPLPASPPDAMKGTSYLIARD